MQSMATVTSKVGSSTSQAPVLLYIEPGSLATGCLFALGLDDLLAAVKAVGADVMAQVNLAGGGLDSQRGLAQRVVRTVHTALGGGFFVLLNCHVVLLKLILVVLDAAVSTAQSGQHRERLAGRPGCRRGACISAGASGMAH